MINKQNIVLIRDHTASMSRIAHAAMKDFNNLIEEIKNSAIASGIETRISIVNCGIAETSGGYSPFNRNTSLVSVAERDVGINEIRPLFSYPCPGGNTPLRDAIGRAIEVAEGLSNHQSIPTLLMGITDGEENSSRHWSVATIANQIKTLTATDMWTFAFRCPRGYTSNLVSLGIPYNNILEWDQTERGMAAATVETASAMRNYYTSRSAGQTTTDRFYVNVNDLRVKDIKDVNLTDISHRVTFHSVGTKVIQIRPLVESFGLNYDMGNWYYELTKTETLQASKRIIIRNKNTRKVYTGQEARDLLNLPYGQDVKIVPQDINSTNYQIFVQSTSVNRNLMPNTIVCHFI